MKTTILITILIFIGITAISQEEFSQRHWTSGTAVNISKHRWELGLLSSSSYGINEKLEISAHPVAFFVIPQVKLKIGWINSGGWFMASEHAVYCPTPFMNLVAVKGTGGLISPEFNIPLMIAVSNRLLVSKSPFRNSLVTLSSGITFSLKSAKPDPRSTIDLPLIYPRLAVFYSQPEIDLNADFRGRFLPRYGWVFRVENYLLCNTKENYFMENKGCLVYISKNEKIRIEGGYKLCFGRYPAGPQWHLLPAADFVFAIGK